MSGMDPAIPGDPVHWDATLSPDVRVLADRLMPLFHADLKRLAQRERGRVSAGATLQTTALVNEAYLKLRGSKGWNTDEHFLRAAALAMRHALVSHALAKLADKRGDGAVHVPITEALDVATDARLRQALRPVLRTSAMIVVAQRVSTIRDADQIVVLDNGRIVGTGTHDQLLADCETYAEIVASQLTAAEAA